MKKEHLLIIIESILDDKLKDIQDIIAVRPKRGQRGKQGHNFDFEESKNQISEILNAYVDSKKEDLKLRFDDLSEEEKFFLKGESFEWEENKDLVHDFISHYINKNIDAFQIGFKDLTDEDKKQLRGSRGQRGKTGLGFEFEEHKSEITDILVSLFENKKSSLKLIFDDLSEEEKDSLKLKFDDLSEEEKDSLKIKGQRGHAGKDFIYGEHEEKISEKLVEVFTENKEDLKLKFDDLSEEEKDSLKIKGQRGHAGKDFIYGEHEEKISEKLVEVFTENKEDLKIKFDDLSEEEKDSLKLKFENLTDEEKRSLRGARGLRGQKGKSIVGPKGETIVGPQGKTIVGRPGIEGPKGLDGRNGEDGVDGQDAPKVIDVSLEKSGDQFSFIFTFDDGSKIGTNELDMPVIRSLLQTVGMMGGSGGSGGDADSAKRLIVERVLDEDAAALRFVSASSGTNVVLGQSTDATKAVILGLTLGSGVTGESVSILLFGNDNNVSYSFALNALLYLTTDGLYSETQPLVGYIAAVAKSNGTGSIFIDIQEIIEI